MRQYMGWHYGADGLCAPHWLGDHREVHGGIYALRCIAGQVPEDELGEEHWRRKLRGHIRPRQIDLRRLATWHDELVRSAEFRGWPSGEKHKTPISQAELDVLLDVFGEDPGEVDEEAVRMKLANCKRCCAQVRGLLERDGRA